MNVGRQQENWLNEQCEEIENLVKKIDNEVSRLLSGFRSGSGTIEGIFNLRTVCE